MNIDEFWLLIEKCKGSDEPENIIQAELEKLPVEEISSYQQHFDTLHENAYIWKLWGAAYIIDGGCSDDGFTDFRYGLISKGRDVYQKALADPDSLTDLAEDQEITNESFGYAALTVYENKTGKEVPQKEFNQASEPIGDEWDFDDEDRNAELLPKLSQLFGM